jgi:uracil-DNA glycosylase
LKDKFGELVEEKFGFAHIINKNWTNIFLKISKKIFTETQEKYILNINKDVEVYPIYEKVFNFTNFCTCDEIKIVIIGQDPYHGKFYDVNTQIFNPEATGLSFSVPEGCKIPSSLLNIFKNLIKFGHIERIPDNGCLERWSRQGVLLINSALTVEKKNPNCHQNDWKEFTNSLINEIANIKENLIFIVWGREAFEKSKIITNKEKHKFIISSHPSGLSANKKFKDYNSFNDTNCFEMANKYLEEFGKEKINW